VLSSLFLTLQLPKQSAKPLFFRCEGLLLLCRPTVGAIFFFFSFTFSFPRLEQFCTSRRIAGSFSLSALLPQSVQRMRRGSKPPPPSANLSLGPGLAASLFFSTRCPALFQQSPLSLLAVSSSLFPRCQIPQSRLFSDWPTDRSLGRL